jgi:putative nucleotidyltransferase with HDIG domain
MEPQPDFTQGPEAAPDLRLEAGDLKTLPLVGLEVLRRAFNPRSNAADIESIVHTDVALTQRLLRVANSALYRRTHPVHTVREAVVHLGLTELRRIVITTSVLDIMSKGLTRDFDRRGFFVHCLGVAAISQELSDALGFEDPPVAFVAGLLHDVGKTFFDQHYPEPFGKALALARTAHLPLLEAERRIFPQEVHPTLSDHTAMGRWALRAWKLPETLAEVAGRHHETPGPDMPFLVQVVQCSDALAQNLGLGRSGNGCNPVWPVDFESLGLDARELLEVIQESLDSCALLGEVAGVPIVADSAEAFCSTLASGTAEDEGLDEDDLRIGHS